MILILIIIPFVNIIIDPDDLESVLDQSLDQSVAGAGAQDRSSRDRNPGKILHQKVQP